MPHQHNCLCDHVTGFLDEGKVVDAVFLSFNKASDRVSHITLESKAGCYGLHGWTIRWMKHWVNDWSQKVVVNTGTKGITAGVWDMS